jgi:flagellar protein FlaG
MPSEVQKIDSLPPAVFMHVEDMPVVKAGDNKSRENSRFTARPTRTQLEDTVKELNAMMERMQTNLLFSIDDASKKVVIKVIDSRTQEVIRQIPPEETLRIASHISKLMGIFIDESA